MIIPSIDLIKGHAVQLIGGKEFKIDAGDPRPIMEKFRTVGEVAVIDLDSALSKGNNKDVILDLIKMGPCRVGGGIRDVESALFWLNQGAAKVILGTAAKPEILKQLPRERVVAALDAFNGEVVVKGWTTKTGRSVKDMIAELKPYVDHFMVTFVEREGRMEGVDLNLIKELAECVGQGAHLTVAGGVTTLEELAAIDRLGVHAQVGMALYTNKMDLGDAFSAPLITDRPDGLFPTVVVDEYGVALGLVYSSKESIRESVRTGTGVYFSRSRKSLWYKGETSGDTQKLLRIEADCDRDALKFVVRQTGAGFCHLKSRSCFSPHDRGLGALMRTLESRKVDAPAGSYTKRLFDDKKLLTAKILEEAQELVEAKTPEETAAEAADVIYFTLTACAAAGVSLEDVEANLDRRALKVSRRPGDAKPHILAQMKEAEATKTKSEDNGAISYMRPDLLELEAYLPIKPLEVLAEEIGLPVERLVKLDANENLYGPIPEIVDTTLHANLHIYPDPSQTYFRRAIADYVKVKPENVVGGTGSDDLIDVIMRLVLPHTLFISTPTFGMYSFLGKINKIKVVDVPRLGEPRFDVDFEGLKNAITKTGVAPRRLLIFLASPNNPTGVALTLAEVKKLSELGCTLVIDEAYAEFCPDEWESATHFATTVPNVIVLRTFSKWAGLAGMRVGFAVAHQTTIEWMMAIKQPYNISAPADVATRAALHHIDKVLVTVNAMKREKKVMLERLNQFKWMSPYPSDSNFVLFKITGPIPASVIASLLRKQGVLIRYFSNARMKDCIRISVGRPQDTDAIITVLKSIESQWTIIDEYRPQAIIFDMDGVLADVSKSYRTAILQTAAFFGAPVTPTDVTNAKAAGNANNDWILSQRLIKSYRESHNISDPVPSLEAVTAKFEEIYQGTPEMPGLHKLETLIVTLELLSHIKGAVPLAIVTGRPKSDANTFLAAHNIGQFFSHIICMEDGPAKPDPAPVTMALQKLGVTRAVMIGDTPDDILSAVRAGIQAVGILAPGDRSPAEAEKLISSMWSAGACKILLSADELKDLKF